MFVQSSHFIEQHGQDTSKTVTFYGQEKTATTIRLAKMNLAVHGLEGDIREANTFYEDVHPIFGKCAGAAQLANENAAHASAAVHLDRRALARPNARS